MVSAWHSHHREEQGHETSATLYWRWNEQAKYHVDFAFGSKDLTPHDVTLGTFAQYVGGQISDHAPLIVDYAFAPSADRTVT
jgi:endonuclease/exonuclease/phosphatase family metal-dependent hydrolase